MGFQCIPQFKGMQAHIDVAPYPINPKEREVDSMKITIYEVTAYAGPRT